MPTPSDSSSPDPEPWGWTRAHRVSLAILLTLALGILTFDYLRHPYRLDDPAVVIDGQPASLEQQLDPNTADWPSLARLPHVGETLARRLVAFRDQNKDASTPAFQSLDDLDKVGGFGPKTRESLRPYLKFPARDAATTQVGGSG